MWKSSCSDHKSGAAGVCAVVLPILLAGLTLGAVPALAGERFFEQDTDHDGKTDRIAHLDASGTIVKLEADTNGDGRMDTYQYYKEGVVLCREQDMDGDGRMEQSVQYDPQGSPTQSRHDLDGDGKMETVRYYQNNAVCRQERFLKDDRTPAVVTEFAGGRAVLEKQDTNGDGGFDVWIRTTEDKPPTREEDVDHDGRMDRFTEYDDRGRPTIMREFGANSSRPDRISRFKDGQLISIEQDRDHDGKVDAKHAYDGGKAVRSEFDNDGDGRFETLARLDDPQWTRVVETTDAHGRLLERRAYAGPVLRKKEIFDASTGRPVSMAEYDRNGKIVLSREAENPAAGLNLTWLYDGGEKAVSAEKDTDGDGRPDVWYHYVNGRIQKVEEDRDRDGRPDLWETYNAAQVVVSRSEDLDFNGTANIEKRF